MFRVNDHYETLKVVRSQVCYHENASVHDREWHPVGCPQASKNPSRHDASPTLWLFTFMFLPIYFFDLFL